MAEAERRPGEGPREAPAQRWDFDSGAVISARPTVVQRPGQPPIAYVGNHAGRFFGVVAEGPSAGQVALDLYVDGIIWSTAAVDERGWLYFGADDDHLYAVDPSRPPAERVAWRRRLGACEPPRSPGPEGVRCDVDGGPTLGPDGDLYVGADGLYRVAPDGRVRWHYPSIADDDDDGGPVRAAHVASTPLSTEAGVVYGNYAREVVALDHDGGLRWLVTLGADVDGSPVAGPDGLVYVGSDDGTLNAIDNEGTVVWTYDAHAEIRSRPVVGPAGRIVFGTFAGKLHALDSAGQLRWTMPTDAPIAAWPVVDSVGRMYVGGRDEYLYALDFEGHVYWRLEMPDQVDSAVAVAPDGTLVVGCDDGVLRGLR